MTHLLGMVLLAATWQDPVITGEIDDSWLPEASGVAASAQHADRLYHINDSGNDPAFIVTTLEGEDVQRVGVSGIKTTDTEDLSIGHCPDQGSCLYIADTGDNDADRSSVSVYAIRERDDYPADVKVDFTLHLHFPDGAHNVESFAMHPSGFAFLLTKEDPAVLYRFTLPKMKAGSTTDVNLTVVGSLQLGAYLPGNKSKNLLPTSMDTSADGQEVAILCKAGAIVLDWDMSTDLSSYKPSRKLSLNDVLKNLKRTVTQLPFKSLPQPEAITWLPDGGILYTTESDKSLKGQVPLVYVGKH